MLTQCLGPFCTLRSPQDRCLVEIRGLDPYNQGSCRASERVCSLDIHNLRRRHDWSFDRSRRLRQKKRCFFKLLAHVSLAISNLYLKRHFSGTLCRNWCDQFDQFHIALKHYKSRGSSGAQLLAGGGPSCVSCFGGNQLTILEKYSKRRSESDLCDQRGRRRARIASSSRRIYGLIIMDLSVILPWTRTPQEIFIWTLILVICHLNWRVVNIKPILI